MHLKFILKYAIVYITFAGLKKGLKGYLTLVSHKFHYNAK